MSRRAILKVVKTNYTPSAPWMVRVPSRLHRIEGARKKFFAKESIAKAYVERLAKQLGDYHTQALGLSDRQKLEPGLFRPAVSRASTRCDDAFVSILRRLGSANNSAVRRAPLRRSTMRASKTIASG